MKESIIIKNFGPLTEVEINDIKPLTVFIGKSAGGKSTYALHLQNGKYPFVFEKCENHPFSIQAPFQLTAT